MIQNFSDSLWDESDMAIATCCYNINLPWFQHSEVGEGFSNEISILELYSDLQKFVNVIINMITAS